MAIALDATAGPNGGVTTWNHTCTGSNLGLAVIVYDAGGDTLTGVTYNSVAMNLVVKANWGGSATRFLYMYYLPGAATGTHAVTLGGIAAGDVIAGSSISYTGVNQSETTGHVNGSAGGAAGYPLDRTVSLTTTFDQCWLLSFQAAGGANPTSALVATTARVGSLALDGSIFDTNAGQAVNTYAVGYHYPVTSTRDEVLAMAISPVQSAVNSSSLYGLMGVGVR